MKFNSILCAILGAAAIFASCKKEEVYTIKVSPETATVYTDEALPKLAVSSDPATALEGKTIEYVSSAADVITVAPDGTLAFAVKDVEQDQNVTITVTVGKEVATSVITVKAQIGRYEVLSIKGTGLQILDRNVGAKSKDEIGNYYQWGKNEPVAANAETAVNANYSADWSATAAGIVDWTKPENTPCPKGWRIPDGDDMKALDAVLENIALWDWDMCSKQEYLDACDALDSMGLIPTGKFQAGKDGKYLASASYFWSSFVDSEKGTVGMFENNLFPLYSKKATYDMAVPVRCVK